MNEYQVLNNNSQNNGNYNNIEHRRNSSMKSSNASLKDVQLNYIFIYFIDKECRRTKLFISSQI